MSIRYLKGIVFSFLFFFLCVPAIYSQSVSPKDQYQKRGHRKEGIKGRLISGGGLELLSATVTYQGEHTAGDGVRVPSNVYAIGFFLPNKTDVDVTVRGYEKRYWMNPLKKRFDAGFNTFTWDGRIIHKFGISQNALHLVVKGKKTRLPLLLPAILYTTPLPETIRISAINFIFFSNKSKVDLNCKIFKTRKETGERGELVFEYDLVDQSPKRPILVSWDGADRTG